MSVRTAAAAALLVLSGCAAAPPGAPAPAGLAPTGQSEWAAACADADEWDRPGPPFRIHGNAYYVGTCGIAAILVAGGPEGHVLIDGGTGAAPPLIAANIAALGFRIEDVALLLSSHEHFDHVGGLADLQRRSGARLLASPAAAPVLSSGETAADDPQAGMHEAFDPARVGGLVTDGQPVRLGTLSLTPLFTPGHTRGALSWQWESCEGGDCRRIVYADSLSPISNDRYRFSDHLDLIAAYRAGLARLAALDCDILMTPHPVASAMRARLVAGSLAEPAPCRAYAATIGGRLDERLAREAAARQ